MTEQLNISPRRPPVISAVPSYPANAPIPSVSRTQPYTNVIPRTDQIPQHGHEWPHVSRQTPNHYPVDLRNLKIRPTAVPIVRHPQDRFRNTEYECYKENSRSPVPQMYHRSFQYEPRYGAVRNGRDVRTGHGIPRGPHGRDAPRTDEEPEDTELELMNNIPYRLRPVPLTGPRCIR